MTRARWNEKQLEFEVTTGINDWVEAPPGWVNGLPVSSIVKCISGTYVGVVGAVHNSGVAIKVISKPEGLEGVHVGQFIFWPIHTNWSTDL